MLREVAGAAVYFAQLEVLEEALAEACVCGCVDLFGGRDGGESGVDPCAAKETLDAELGASRGEKDVGTAAAGAARAMAS